MGRNEEELKKFFAQDNNDEVEDTSEFDQMFDEKARQNEVITKIKELTKDSNKSPKERNILGALEEERDQIMAWIRRKETSPTTHDNNIPKRLRSKSHDCSHVINQQPNDSSIAQLTEKVKNLEAEVLPDAKLGKKFSKGRRDGAVDGFTKMMLRICKEHLQKGNELPNRAFWDAIPLHGVDDKDAETGISIQDKEEDEQTIYWISEDGRNRLPVQYKNFKKRATKVRALAKE
ncbi:hypothetical protein [Desulforhopalus sp. IMCC35007]|uniref:hypothetical protein n=1 Tax=Desulforhopalus sp. IMCC35007 TaxID=2569543 RepID=UPI0010AEABD1|nr:hypothetical protein [Desulforhopalus sp. IMCC35007]TKB07442.1 hypothetical protein FCL48_17015 [Desulforhopalus sp. IMCC35007]